MDGSLTNEGEKLALDLMFRGSNEQPTNIYLGLATDSSLEEDVTLADVTEIDDVGYARQEVVFGESQLVDGKQTIENSSQQEFGPWSEDEDIGAKYAFLTDTQTGTSGKILALYEITSAKTPSSGESLIVTVGNCGISFD